MEKSVTYAYNQDWKRKSQLDGRINFQTRAVLTISRLFTDIIDIAFRGNILDIGCGDGTFVIAANNMPGIAAQGIDIDNGINFEKDALPFHENEFNHTIMYSVIEHILDPGNILSETKRILKNMGTLTFILPNIEYCKYNFYDDPTHIHPYTPSGLIRLMEIYNFKKRFIGLWTVGKSSFFWKLPSRMQFWIGKHLPFSGNAKFAPSLFKGKSTTMLCVFTNSK